MTTFELQETKLDLISQIIRIEDADIIERVKDYLSQFQPTSAESNSVREMRAAIERSEEEIRLGQLRNHTDVINKIRERIKQAKR